MTWWGVLILCLVCLVAGGVVTWAVMRRRTSDPVARQAIEMLEEARDEEREEEAGELEALMRANPFRRRGGDPP